MPHDAEFSEARWQEVEERYSMSEQSKMLGIDEDLARKLSRYSLEKLALTRLPCCLSLYDCAEAVWEAELLKGASRAFDEMFQTVFCKDVLTVLREEDPFEYFEH